MFINKTLIDNELPKDLDTIVKWMRKAKYKRLTDRDTRYLISLLVNLPKVDLHLLSLIRYRKLAAGGYNYSIKFPDEYKASETELKQIAEMKYRFEKTRMNSLIPFIVESRISGMGAMQTTWSYSDTLKNFVEKKFVHPLTDIDFDLNDVDKLINVITDTDTGRFTRKEFDPEITITVKDNPLGTYEVDYPGGLLRANIVRVVLKYWDFFTWANSNEKYADPMRYAVYDMQFKDKLSEILENLAKLGTDSYGAFPRGVDVKILEALKEGAIKSHTELEASVNRAMSLSIAGQYSAFDSRPGQGYAQSKVSYEIAEDVVLDDLAFVEREISNQYLLKDYEMNYGQPRNAMPVFEFKKLFIHDRESHAAMVAMYRNAGIPVADKNIYDDIDFIKPEEPVIESEG